MELEIKTLTPLWTGGVETSRMDRIHETGIIGGLRWWYEVIMRGLGGDVCNPTSDNPDDRCPHNNNHYCDVCKLFGATGWKRQFQIRVSDQNIKPAWTDRQSLNIRPYGRNRGWFLSPGHMGTITFAVSGDPQALARLVALLCFLETWGQLGARPQLGYGLFQITTIKNGLHADPQNEAKPIWHTQGEATLGQLPDLRTFTFFKLQFQPTETDWWRQIPTFRAFDRSNQNILTQLAEQGMIPVTPILKNHLRFEQRWSSNSIPHWFFGTLTRDQRIRSKISLSWAYDLKDNNRWEIRGWVYLPQDTIGRYNQTEVIRVLQNTLNHPQHWFRALGIETGYRYPAEVIFSPAPWQRRSARQVADFLNNTTGKVMRDER